MPELGLDWFVNVQFIGDHLLEINPRISTIVYQEDLNLPYLAVRHAVGELDATSCALVRACAATRRALRYYDQVEWDEPLSVHAPPPSAPACGSASAGSR